MYLYRALLLKEITINSVKMATTIKPVIKIGVDQISYVHTKYINTRTVITVRTCTGHSIGRQFVARIT